MGLVQLFILNALEMCATLILWNALNIKRKNNILKNMSVVILMSIIILLTYPMNVYIGVVINYLSLIMLIRITFNIRFIDAFYEFCMIALMNFVIQLIYTIPIKLIFNTIGLKYYFDQGFLITILALITSIIIYKRVPLGKLIEKFNYSIKKTYILLLNILIYVLISKIIWEHNNDLILDNIIALVIIPITFITINIMYFKYSIKRIEQKKVMEMHEKYSPIMLNLIEEVRRRQHDFKNHINTIYGISEVSNTCQIKENIQHYITSLNGSLGNIDNLVFINNQLLAAILYSKICEAKKNNINILYDIKLETEKFIINDYELTEIITNLLDNAFEAVAGNEVADREVNIVIMNEKDLFYMEVKNKGTPIEPLYITKIFNSGFSTKGIEGRGYGLYNIKKIVEYHNGEIQLSNDNGYNIFRIYFNKLSGISGSPQSQRDPV